MNMNDYKNVTDRIFPGSKCREEVIHMVSERNVKNVKNRFTGRVTAAVSAALIAACIGTVTAAAGLGAFAKLADKKDRTITYANGVTGAIDKFDYNEYDRITQYAVDYEEPSCAENDFFKVKLDSVYFDGFELIMGFSGEMSDGNPDALSALTFMSVLEINGRQVRSAQKNLQDTPYWGGTFVIDEGTDNSFTGSLSCFLPYSARFDDTAEVTVKILRIGSVEKMVENSQNYDIMPIGENNTLTLSADVTADTELMREIDKTVSDDGFSAEIYSISPAVMTVKYDYPRWYDENEEHITWYENGTEMKGPKYHIICQFYDADGNYIEYHRKDPVETEMYDGIYVYTLQSPRTDTVYCRFCNSQTGGTGEMEIIKELKIDLS